jgi:putative ABC transport system permease protein
MFLPKLALSNLVAHKTRVALTIAAIALSVSLVVAVTSGYASIEAAAYKFFTHYLGTTDATITSSNYGSGVPESLVNQLRADPRVKQAVGRFETEKGLLSEPSRVAEVIGIRMPDDQQIGQIVMEGGTWFDSADGNVAVIDQAAAKILNVTVGGDIVLPKGERKITLKVVGIAHKPEVMAQFRPTLYLPLHTLQRFEEFGNDVTRVTIELNDKSKADKFAADWKPKLQAIDPNIRMKMSGEGRQMLGQNLQAVHLLSYMGGVVSMVAATFIVFSALSMGVTERQRTLAMLRAVGAFRAQIAGLVVLEGVLIATTGALVGVPLGAFWIHLLAWHFDKLFYAGTVISPGGVAFGVIGSVAAALAASLLPAWSASRVSPLEAMSSMGKASSTKAPWVAALVGLVLVSIEPTVLFGPTERLLGLLGAASPHDSVRLLRFYFHFAVGLPALLIGFFLLSPMFVWAIEAVLAPVVAAALGLRYALLRQQLSSGIWRAAGTCTALMIGLAVLIVLQTQGRTALRGWKLPDKFPDIFIVDFTGIDLAEAAKLEDVPGIRKGEVMPIAIVSPGLPQGFLGMAGLMVMPDRTMFIGVDPNRALKLMELDFREGNAQDAVRMLNMGRHVLVTAEFKQLKGLGMGDKLPLKTDHGWEDYTIAGVVWSPGIDVIVSAFDMGRQMDQRTAASVFGSIQDAQRDFGVKKFLLFAANLNYFVEKDDVLKQVQTALKAQGMRGGDVRHIKAQIEGTFYNLLLLVSTVAFAAMAVAALGVTNTIMASVRTRRWQFGVLRSIGVTRSQLLRLVLAEAILLGLVACVLGTAAGLEMSVNAVAVQVDVTGYAPDLFIPWNYVALGAGIILVVSILASLWPAILVARTQPLDLLQSGRAAA